jgi:WD40 repeat protein
MIEMKDSFSENYDSSMGMDMSVGDSKPMMDFTQLKQIEESQMIKRSIFTYTESESEQEFIDFVWDSYNNIYIGTDMGIIYLYDINLIKISINFQNEPKDNLRLNGAVTSMLLTQRFLIASTDDCKISMINVYIPENELGQYRPSIGNPENYRMLEVEKEYKVLDGEVITFMKYDPKFSKLLVGTENSSFYLILLPAEILVKEKEKDEITENNNIISPDIDHFEECKFHTDKIIGLRELGNSSQFITIGADRNIIIWELSDRNVKSLYSLDYIPSGFEVDQEGDLLFTGSKDGVFRVYDITNRSSIRLIHQIKFSDESIDKILLGFNPVPSGEKIPFLTLFKKSSQTIYFASAEASKSFIFLGYFNTPYPVLDIAYNPGNVNHAEILVLVKQMILSYEIPKFYYDHKIATEIKEKKEKDIFLNFELQYEQKARKCDSDLRTIFKQGQTEFLWLTGNDNFLRIYNLPNENFEILRENKRSPENPVEEMRGHDMEITNGICNDTILITGGHDGKIQIRKERTIYKQFRSHSCLHNGVSAVFYSQNRKLFYSCGFDGSIFLFSESETFDIPSEPISSGSQNDSIEVFDTIDEIEDSEVKRFPDLIIEEHNRLIKLSKKTNQAVLKTKLDEIRVELNKFLRENNDLEEIEKLNLNEMIIDLNRIEKESERGELECDKMTKTYFEELCELEILKEKLFEKTYNSMVLKEDIQGQTRITNNNIRMTSSTNGEKILKSFPIRNFTEAENTRIDYVKQMRLIEINEKYKRKAENVSEVFDETKFSHLNEEYILNRIPSKISLVETEIKPSEIMDSHEGDFASREKEGGRQYKVAKYKLQREPYENENLKNTKNDADNLDQANFRPDEQLLKEDLSIKYKTVLAKPIVIEFTKNLANIDSFNLLYSPFELYTNFRKRNQIYLIVDIIQGLKHTFNKEFKQFLVDKNALLEKFNTNKLAIENIREVLGDVYIENYNYAVNPHEDNEWIKKVEEWEIKVPKYFSKEEKKRLEEEKRIEVERLKALQGDTCN